MKKLVLLVLLAFLLIGCIESEQVKQTQTPPQQMTPVSTFFVKVVKVIDGDTIDIQFKNGTIERVRMLGVDTPETTAEKNKIGEYDGITDLECLAMWGKKAKEFTEQLEGKEVIIEFDNIAGTRGYYGRLLAYVYFKNTTDFTAELVKRGYARVYVEGECKKETEYLKYQEQAFNQRIGLWSCLNTASSTAVVIQTVHYDACGDADDRECLNERD